MNSFSKSMSVTSISFPFRRECIAELPGGLHTALVSFFGLARASASEIP